MNKPKDINEAFRDCNFMEELSEKFYSSAEYQTAFDNFIEKNWEAAWDEYAETL